MKAILLTVCGFFIYTKHCLGQNLTLSIPHKQVFVDEQVAVDILTLDFDSIASTQFSISWDPNIIQLDNTEDRDLSLVAVGDTDAQNGSINISWFDIDGEGKSLEDGKAFLRLNFTAVGEIRDVSPIEINGDSLMIQTFKATPIPFQYVPITLVPENGSVEIIDEDNPQSNFEIINQSIESISCFGGENGSILLTANQSGFTYQWSGPNDFESDLLSIENLAPGEYSLNVFDENGDLVFASNYLVPSPLAALNIIDIITVDSGCELASGSAQFEMEGGTAPYTFTLDGQQQFEQESISSLSSGVYQLTVTDANDCTLTADFVIGQEGSFAFSLGDNIEACEGQIVNVNAGQFESYAWSNGEDVENINIETSGEYIVTVTNAEGCSAVDTIMVNFIDQIQLLSTSADYSICPGDSIELSVSGGVNYEWIDPNNELTDTQGNTIMVSPNESTIYSVISEGECGTDELEIPVALYKVTATAGEDMCVAIGESVTLNASGGNFYYWSGSEYPLSSYDVSSPTSFPDESTEYFVMIVDENDCATFDTVAVFIADDPAAFIPHINMITPNGDGQNDALDFGDIDKFGVNNLRVFNRWGKVVYEKLNYQNDQERFSGVYNGEPLPAGNYYYVLSFRDDKKIKQTLTIARED